MNKTNLYFLRPKPQNTVFNKCLGRLNQLIEYYGKEEVFKALKDINASSYPELVRHLKNLARTYGLSCVQDVIQKLNLSKIENTDITS